MSYGNSLYRLLLVPAILFFLSGIAYPQSVSKYAGEFLAIGVGARSQALGASYVAISNDASAVYWNPAGLAQLNYPNISVMHAEQFAGEVNYDFASIAIPSGEKMTFGLGLIRLGIDGIPDTRKAFLDMDTNNNGIIDDDERPDYDQISYFSNSDYAAYFSVSYKKREKLYYGANIKLIKRSIGEYSAWGVGFDLAAMARIGDRLTLGANFMDITTTYIAWDTGTKELISPTLKIGGAYRWDLDIAPVSLIPVMDADIRFEGRKFATSMDIGPMSIDPHFGIEFDFNNRIFIRSGYDDIDRVSFGIGIHLPKLIADYSFTSYSDYDEPGDTHKISISLSIKEERFRRKQ